MLNVFMLSVFMLSVFMLSVVMLNVVILSVVMLSVIMLSVIMLNVLTPVYTLTSVLEKYRHRVDKMVVRETFPRNDRVTIS
jgi:hypothetical protein